MGGSERERGALGTAGVRSMGSEVICLGVYERPDSAVKLAERPARSENGSLCCTDIALQASDGAEYRA